MRELMPRIELREDGIYTLPDGRKFVVCSSGDGPAYLLYSLESFRRQALPEYRTQVNGRILSRGVVTRWRVEDLKDSKRTAEPL